MYKLVNILFIATILIFCKFVIAQQGPHESIGRLYKQSDEDQFTGATVPHDPQQSYSDGSTSATSRSDPKAQRLNDLNSLDILEFKAKYGYSSEVIAEYNDHFYQTKVLPAFRERKRQEEADKQEEFAIKAIFAVLSLSLLVASFFTIRKHAPVAKDKIKELAEKLKIKIFNFRSYINKKMLKQKYEKELVRQNIKEKVRTEVQANNVAKNNDVSPSAIDLSKLKQEIAIALKNDDYNKVKELIDLAEKLDKLN